MAPATTPAAGSGTLITQETAAKAFAAWETAFRENAAAFLSADETAQLAVADVSTSRAIYFMALLRKVA